MFTFVKLMGSAFSDNKIQADVEEVFELEKSLAEVKKFKEILKNKYSKIYFQLTLSAAERRNTTFKSMTIQQLINELPEVSNPNYFENLKYQIYLT